MDENARKHLGEAGRKYLARFDKYHDRVIGRLWVAIAKGHPHLYVTTHKGVVLYVRRNVVGILKVSYEAFLEMKTHSERVGWFHCMSPIAGRVQVTNANVYEVGGVDYRRHGVGTAIYNLIEWDVQAAGGEGLEPHFGSMNEEAIAFWKTRRPEHADKIAGLNKAGPQIGSWFFD